MVTIRRIWIYLHTSTIVLCCWYKLINFFTAKIIRTTGEFFPPSTSSTIEDVRTRNYLSSWELRIPLGQRVSDLWSHVLLSVPPLPPKHGRQQVQQYFAVVPWCTSKLSDIICNCIRIRIKLTNWKLTQQPTPDSEQQYQLVQWKSYHVRNTNLRSRRGTSNCGATDCG